MNILDIRISTFRSTRETEVDDEVPISMALNSIKNGNYRKEVEKVRAGDEEAKKNLPTIAFHGRFEGFRKAKDFVEASGLVILDIDDVEDNLEEVKQDIMDNNNHVLATMISPSGNGIKVLYYVNSDLITADNYRQIGKQIVSDFEVYGKVDYLSITDCLIMTYDPNILINYDVEPAFIYIKDSIKLKAELEKLDPNRPLWDSAEDFFDTVLANDIASKTNNNFHYIQVSILDLAKFGFYHPAEDLSFVIDYAESNFERSASNKKRFLEVAELAKSYPQSKWPYKIIRRDDGDGDDEDDGFIDYSEYITEDKKEKSVLKEDFAEGLVDYSTLFESVLEVIKEGDRVGFETSFKNFSEVFRFRGAGILTVTGIPGHGKTEFIDACILDLARLYNHQSIVVGFEQTPEEHIIKLMRRLAGINITCPSYLKGDNMKELETLYNFIIKHIKHIDTKKSGGNINEILEISASHIKNSRENGEDIRYIVLDPFNMLSIKGKLSGHEKIEEILRRLTHFSHQMNVMVILVAHPFKMRVEEKTGAYAVPDFYSVKGSSAFFEMSYHGLVVYRYGYQPTDAVLVKVLKVKQNNLGKAGEEVFFNYHKESGRYIPINREGDELAGDHRLKNWLKI